MSYKEGGHDDGGQSFIHIVEDTAGGLPLQRIALVLVGIVRGGTC
jgi:hypothetical protein